MKYVLDLLSKTDILGVKPAELLGSKTRILMEMITLFSNKRRYQSLVGKLIYLIVTRLDITFPIRIVSQFICGNLFLWRCKKHNVVPRFSGESEYKAMAHPVCELMWI